MLSPEQLVDSSISHFTENELATILGIIVFILYDSKLSIFRIWPIVQTKEAIRGF